jgi:8-oxo-dGTP pyrophosphatase MutT (NUDIX family)
VSTSNPPTPQRHRNDIYGDLDATVENPAVPAATVVLLRDAPHLEVLMLHKTSQVAFGGMWVFPGGRVDDADTAGTADDLEAARNAAARETHEETGLVAMPDEFVWFSFWVPPPSTPRRFATWFFAAAATAAAHQVDVDGGEIQDHAWLAPAEALARHAAGEIDLAPPTWVTLYQLSLHSSTEAALERLRSGEPRHYATRLGKRHDGVRVAMWRGDSGYETDDADAQGERHRLVMSRGGFVFENTVVEY